MYWTLDTRPPTLDERILQAKARHAERVDQIAAEEPVPQLEVPKVEEEDSFFAELGRKFNKGLGRHMARQLLLPGQYLEVPGHKSATAMARNYQQTLDAERMRALDRMAAQQNMGMNGLRYGEGLVPQSNPWAAAHGAPGGLSNLGMYPFPLMTEAQHTFQITKDGTRWLSSRGPFYHPPTSFGTITEYR